MRASLVVGFAIACASARAARAEESGELGDPARAGQLATSVHRELSCTACHREHASPAQACGGCHDREAAASTRGGHAARGPSCVDCHGSHDVLGRQDPASRSSVYSAAALCGGCHAAELTKYRAGAHAPSGATIPATCVSCHGAHDVTRPVPAACGACHVRDAADWATSRHASAQPSLACGTCHRAHDGPAALAPGGARTSDGSVQRCTACHRAQAEDFARSLHGKALALGDLAAPVCTTCHSSHAIRSANDPAATTSEPRRGQTCGRCHPSATAASFAAGAFHDDGRGGHRAVRLVRVMYTMMIVVVIALMLLHNALDLRRRLVDRRKRRRGHHRPDAAVRRFTAFERVQHWALAASFLTLVATGFSLALGLHPIGIDPAAWAAARAWLHRGAALVFVALALCHAIWMFATPRGRMNLAAMRPRVRSMRDAACVVCACMRIGPPTTADWRAMIETLRYNLGRRDTRPAQGRFTYAEKMEYFALVWGGIVMTATGFALWLSSSLLARTPFWVASLADVVHLFEATLAALAIVVWHFYYVMFRPEVFPISRAMITGTISEHEAHEEHALEAQGSNANPSSAAAEPAGDARSPG